MCTCVGVCWGIVHHERGAWGCYAPPKHRSSDPHMDGYDGRGRRKALWCPGLRAQQLSRVGQARAWQTGEGGRTLTAGPLSFLRTVMIRG